MECLAEEMGEGEAEVKGGIAEVDDFMVKENESVPVDEDVFGNVVTMHDAGAGGEGFLDQTGEERGGFFDVSGGELVVGFLVKKLMILCKLEKNMS